MYHYTKNKVVKDAPMQAGSYADLPSSAEIGEVVKTINASGVIQKKPAGLYVFTEGKGWVLLEKTKENGEL